MIQRCHISHFGNLKLIYGVDFAVLYMLEISMINATLSWCRERDEGDSDIRDLVVCFSGLEEKVLAQYTFAKVQLNVLPQFS